MTQVEHRFTLVTDSELTMAYEYVAKKDKIRLRIERLRAIANNAGKTRINAEGKLTPRQVATRAVDAYEREYRGIRIGHKEYTALVHGVAKILSERNTNTRAKRSRDKAADELKNVGYNINNTPEMNRAIQQELEEIIERNKQQKKAGTH
jgi:hypothetical protein